MSNRRRPAAEAGRSPSGRRRRNQSEPFKTFDLESMSGAIRDFLESAGIDLSRPQLSGTPDRVARAWSEEFLDGYRADPASILRDSFDAGAGGSKRASRMVLVKAVPFHGLCPHHLLPFHGVAHIAYLPDGKLAPLSALVRLVDCFAHRLEVQETVTRQVAESLVQQLKAKGAAALLESEQTCMTLRGVKRRGSRTLTSYFAGEFASRADLRSEFLRSIGKL